MSLPTTLVQINGTDLTPYLKQPSGYKVEPNKLWRDAGRNMAGELKSTFVGIFPKINLNFRHLTRSELDIVINLLEQPQFTCAWFDEKSNTNKVGTFYAGQYSYGVLDRDAGRYEPFTVNLIAYKKKT